MLKQSFCLALLATSFSLFSCKKEAGYNNSQEPIEEVINNQSQQRGRPVIIPTKATTVYFTRNFGKSDRTEFYSVDNLTGLNPKITLVAAGDRKFFPSVLQRWTMNENTNEVWQVSGSTLQKFSIGEYFSLPVNSVENAVKSQFFGKPPSTNQQVVIDYKNNKLYAWTSSGKKIIKTDMDGNNEALVFTTPNTTQINCMDIDNIKGIIYYADALTNTIRSVKINGAEPKILIKNAGVGQQIGYFAQDIHVDALHGNIYWIKDNPVTKRIAIMKAKTDGTGVTTLWDAGYSGLNGTGFNLQFVIDEQSQQIFFIRTLLETNKLDINNFDHLYKDHLIRMNMDGTNTKALFDAEYVPAALGRSDLFKLTISKQEPLN